MKNINLLLPNPLLIYHEKFSPRIAAWRIIFIGNCGRQPWKFNPAKYSKRLDILQYSELSRGSWK